MGSELYLDQNPNVEWDFDADGQATMVLKYSDRKITFCDEDDMRVVLAWQASQVPSYYDGLLPWVLMRL